MSGSDFLMLLSGAQVCLAVLWVLDLHINCRPWTRFVTIVTVVHVCIAVRNILGFFALVNTPGVEARVFQMYLMGALIALVCTLLWNMYVAPKLRRMRSR